MGPVIRQSPQVNHSLHVTRTIWQVGAGSPASLTTADRVTGTILRFAGQSLPGSAHRLWIAGGVVSTTVTVKLPVDTLPAASVAVQLTVVSPGTNTLPEVGSEATVGAGSRLSVAATVNDTGDP